MKPDLFDRLFWQTPERYRWPKSGQPYWVTGYWVGLIGWGFVGEIVRTIYG